MRIAYILADRGVPVWGTKGASVHVREMIRALGERNEINIFCARLGDALGHLPVDGTHLAPKPARPDGDGPAGRDLERIRISADMTAMLNSSFCDQPYDLLYERYSLFSDAGLNSARQWEVPLLLEVNAPLIEERGAVEPLPLAAVAREVEERVFRGADAVLAVSDSMAAYARAVGADASRVHVVPNGVDPDKFAPGLDPADARSRLDLDGRVIIIFAGSLKAWHGVDMLLDAYAAVSYADWHLVLVGDGPQRTNLESQAASLRCPGRVTFTGAVQHEDVALYLAAADITVAPYRYRADFYFSPLKVFEYLAAGKPVIASGIGQIAEVIRHGENGYLVPPDDVEALADALVRLTQDEDLRNRLARHAPGTVTSWKSTAQRVLQIARAVQHERTTA